jgi:NADPH:quinone reductase-like Zn-dependent oxidoreductase
LVEGGSGGIGHLAIQIANLHNARCLCTCSGLRAEKLVTGYGGIPFDYNNSNRYSQMSDFLGDTEVDMLLENSFGHKLEQKIDLMSDRACMVCIGQKSEFDLSPSTTLKMCLKNIELKFLSIMASRGVRSQLLIRLSDLLSKSDVGVNKHAIFPINEIDKCLELYNNEQVLGKIVLSA